MAATVNFLSAQIVKLNSIFERDSAFGSVSELPIEVCEYAK